MGASINAGSGVLHASICRGFRGLGLASSTKDHGYLHGLSGLVLPVSKQKHHRHVQP